HSHQVHALEGFEVAGVMAAHHAQTDQSGPQIPAHAHAPAFATVFTAWTIRSRSSSLTPGWTGSDSTSPTSRSVTGRSSSVANVGRRCTGVGQYTPPPPWCSSRPPLANSSPSAALSPSIRTVYW